MSTLCKIVAISLIKMDCKPLTHKLFSDMFCLYCWSNDYVIQSDWPSSGGQIYSNCSNV